MPILFLLLFLLLPVQSKAPLPAPMVDAKRVYLVNESAKSELFDFFYEEMKTWNRYEIVDSPDKADLVFELTIQDDKGVYTNPANLRSYSYSKYKVRLAVTQSKTLLWSTTEAVKGTKDKDQQKAIKRLIDDLKRRAG